MHHLEPTYLRYIYDGLIKGSIHPENAAELPDGLIGMYEEVFDERTSVVDRQKLLQRFVLWALLRKEVSAAFVAEILGEPEDDIQEFISNYSAWFNSPESGKYQLYHERLKVYLLQKMSEQELQVLHEQIISRLELAIEEQKVDEFEWYGLEFLTSHLAIAAMLNGDGKKLIELAYSQTHWQRQLKISKGYAWSKNGIKEVMAWASKYNDDEVIECGLQMVDLHHQEQNAAPQIIGLVAEGDFEAALKRVEQFGGNNLAGKQKKFSLYMLCLLELTLSKNINISSRKLGFIRILKHLDENLEVSEQMLIDLPSLDWVNFFPNELINIISNESAFLEVDCSTIYNRTIDHKYLIKRNKAVSGITLIESKNDFSLKDINNEIGFAIKIENKFQRNLEIYRIFKRLNANNKSKKAKQLLTLLDDPILRQISLFECYVNNRVQNRIQDEELDLLFETLMSLFKDESIIKDYLHILVSQLVQLNLKCKIPYVLKLESNVYRLQQWQLPNAVRLLLSDLNYEGALFLVNLYFDYQSYVRLFSMNLIVGEGSIPFFKTTILKFVSQEDELDYDIILQICLKELSNKEFIEKSIENKKYVNSQYHNCLIFSILIDQLFSHKKYQKIWELYEEIKNEELHVMMLSRISTRLFLMNKPNLSQKLVSITIEKINSSQDSDRSDYFKHFFAELILQEDNKSIVNLIQSKPYVHKHFIQGAIRHLERMNKLSSNNTALINLIDELEKNSSLCYLLIKISFLAHKESNFIKEKEIYARFLNVLNQIKEESSSDMIKMHHSAYLISTDKLNNGLQIFKSIRDPNFKLSVWFHVGGMFSQLHDLSDTLEFLKNIEDNDNKHEFLRGIIKNIDFGNEYSTSINRLLYLTYENSLLLSKVLIGINYNKFFSTKRNNEIDNRLGIRNNHWALEIKKQINYIS